MNADELSRIDKLFVDSSQIDPDAARARRASCRVDIVCGPEVETSRTAQAAVLTALECARRCFPGSVKLSASEAVRASLFGNSNDMSEANSAIANGPARYTIAVGTAEGLTDDALQVTFDGWGACVAPPSSGRLSERDYCPLAGVLGGALAVSEIFMNFAAIELSATHRRVFLSLWQPWSNSPDSGPKLRFFPTRAWLIGLGHLGQAYAWAYSWLHFDTSSSAELWLVDDEKIVNANLETCLLTTPLSLGKRKTRTVADWLSGKGIASRIIERRVDENFKVTAKEPQLVIGGVDANRARHFMAMAGGVLIDVGLGNRFDNFDTIALRTWPNQRAKNDLWPIDLEDRNFVNRLVRDNTVYSALADDECGRVRLAERSVGVPFVGAAAASFAWAQILRELHESEHVTELKIRLAVPSQLDVFTQPSSAQDVAHFEYIQKSE